MKHSITAVAALISIGSMSSLSALEIHVAPDGDDSAIGTNKAPLASLGAAQQQVRKLRHQHNDQAIEVILHDGTWYLTEPLVFSHRDSGSAQAPVIWRAAEHAKPVISGGQAISGWQQRGNRWVAQLADVADGKWYFRELFINGRWAQRARWPNADGVNTQAHQAIDEVAEADVEAAEDKAVTVSKGEQLPFIPWPQATQPWTLKTMDSCQVAFPQGSLPTWSNIEDVELHYSGAWDTVVKRLADKQDDLITLQAPHAFFHQNILPHGRSDRVRWCHFENAPEMLDQPGEWCLDKRDGTLSYIPLAGESINDISAVAPRVNDTVIKISGNLEQPVEHLHFSGITVAHAGFTLPAQGFNGLQAGAYFPEISAEEAATMPIKKGLAKVDHALAIPALPGSFSATGWQHGSFTHGELRDSAAYGLHLAEGCRDILVEGNRVHQLGGGGIRIGENWRYLFASGGSYKPTDPDVLADLRQRAPQQLTIRNNVVSNTGIHFWGTVGIWSSAAMNLTISHNEVSDMPYTGISSGWFWHDNRPLANGSVTIANNRILNVLNRLADGGSFYCLGSHPDSVVTGNVMVGTGRNRFTHRFLIAPCILMATVSRGSRSTITSLDSAPVIKLTKVKIPGAVITALKKVNSLEKSPKEQQNQRFKFVINLVCKMVLITCDHKQISGAHIRSIAKLNHTTLPADPQRDKPTRLFYR